MQVNRVYFYTEDMDGDEINLKQYFDADLFASNLDSVRNNMMEKRNALAKELEEL